MHHHRAGSLEALVLDAVRSLTDAEIDAATGRSRAYFYAVSNPMDRTVLRLDHAAALDAALMAKGRPAVFAEQLQAMTDEVLARLGGKAPPTTDIPDGLMRLAVEVGELNGAVAKALRDRKIDLQEGREIAGEAEDVIDQARRVRDAAEPPALGPAGVKRA